MTKIKKLLKPVGMAVFVNHYPIFEDFAERQISRAEAEEQLVKAGKAEGGAGRCVSGADKIFRLNLQYEALKECLDSEIAAKGITTEARARAKQILSDRAES